MQISVSKGATKIALTKHEQKVLANAKSVLGALSKYDEKAQEASCSVSDVLGATSADGTYVPVKAT